VKLLRFAYEQKTSYGMIKNGMVEEINGSLGNVIDKDYTFSGNTYPLEKIKLLPSSYPSKVLCLGLNYRSHAEELGLPAPLQPIIFMKPSTAVIGHKESILYPPQSKRVDYEAELAVIIGKKCYRVDRAQALDYVVGYSCANDITARDLQPKDGQWTYSKSFDTFAPLGPWIETGLDNPESLQVSGYLNGKLVQDGFTADHVFTVDYLIHYISHCMTLLPGDVIMTGTPSGIGPMEKGDVFKVSISGIGELENDLKSL